MIIFIILVILINIMALGGSLLQHTLRLRCADHTVPYRGLGCRIKGLGGIAQTSDSGTLPQRDASWFVRCVDRSALVKARGMPLTEICGELLKNRWDPGSLGHAALQPVTAIMNPLTILEPRFP